MTTSLKLPSISIIAFVSLLALSNTAPAFYQPHTQRWITRDPLNERGFELLHRPATVDPVAEIRYSTDHLVAPNLFKYVGNRPPTHLDAFGLFWLELLEPATTTGGNPLTCALASETEPIQNAPGYNGSKACIWKCNNYGDQPPTQPNSTIVTFTKPNKPCPPPPGCHGIAPFKDNPFLNPRNPYE
jgi:hypothetical protein